MCQRVAKKTQDRVKEVFVSLSQPEKKVNKGTDACEQKAKVPKNQIYNRINRRDTFQIKIITTPSTS